MDADLCRRIQKNLFEASWPALDPWDAFKWHRSQAGICDTWQQNSSQALAIDVFGTLRASAQLERDAVLGQLCTFLGLPSTGSWQVELEWEDEQNRLNEPKKSQIDAIARSSSVDILFECKFGEVDGGSCSQTRPRSVQGSIQLKQCNGSYVSQINPLDVKAGYHRCALTAKGIRYWEVIPNVFKFSAEEDYSKCPFAGSWYQWMRNLVMAEKLRHTGKLQAAFVIVYADHPNLPFSRKLSGHDERAHRDWVEFRQALQADKASLHSLSYQELLALVLHAVGENSAKWRALNTWVAEKIRAVGEQTGRSANR